MLVYIKGRFAVKELVGEHPHSPEVYFLIISRTLKKFRRQIKRRAAEGASQLFFFVYSPPEVAQFDIPLHKNKRT
jgi:hypothetical protein